MSGGIRHEKSSVGNSPVRVQEGEVCVCWCGVVVVERDFCADVRIGRLQEESSRCVVGAREFCVASHDIRFVRAQILPEPRKLQTSDNAHCMDSHRSG